jgi:hypothetical protein
VCVLNKSIKGLTLQLRNFLPDGANDNIKSMFIGFFVESQMVIASNVEPIIIGFLGVKCKKDMALPEDSPSVKITTSLI